MEGYSVVGKRLPRVDGLAKAIGQAKYAGDMLLPRMLYGKILRSCYPHARILDIDTSKAERLPGVKAVVIGKDFGGFRYGYAPDARDKSPLAVDKVRFVGDEVAAVAAVDEDTAEEALQLIKIDYEELPAVFDADEAMKEGAPQLHDICQRNIAVRRSFHFGDIETGFRESDHIREDRFETQLVIHGFIEPHAVLAAYELPGKITISASTQTPYMLSRLLSIAFNVPQNRVRIIQPYVGAGFGGKAEAYPLQLIAVLLSQKTGRPVRITDTQEEVLLFSQRRAHHIVEIKTGVKRDGSLVAREYRIITNTGAYVDGTPIILQVAGVLTTIPYRLPNVKYEAYGVCTNTPWLGPHRGLGFAEVHFAADIQLDMIASDLKIDPVEIRLRNAVQAGDITANKLELASCELTRCIEKVAEASNWAEKREKKEIRGSKRRGIGIGCGSFVSGTRSFAHTGAMATIKINEDGTVNLSTGTTDIGQGSDTVLSQIAAEELGLRLEDIAITRIDTDATPLDSGTYSSRVTLEAGNAVKLAAADAKRQLAAIAAENLGVSAEELEFRNREISVRGNPDKAVPFARAAKMAAYSQRDVLGKGHYPYNIELWSFHTGTGNASMAYSFGAMVAEVEVDVETGKVKLTDASVAHDGGIAINPMAVEGQIEGQVIQGLGETLYEELIMENGRTINASFADYKMPRSLDMPEMNVILIEKADPYGPFGAKEVGEGTISAVYPAIVNAIHSAVGVWIEELPVTPEKILKALKEKRGGES